MKESIYVNGVNNDATTFLRESGFDVDDCLFNLGVLNGKILCKPTRYSQFRFLKNDLLNWALDSCKLKVEEQCDE